MNTIKLLNNHFLVLTIWIIGLPLSLASKEYSYPYNSLVEREVWDKAARYFLPTDHPMKSLLDSIFSTIRATASREDMIAAGFFPPPKRGNDHIFVAAHPHTPGYLFKGYYDAQKPKREVDNMVSRIKGAKLIAKYIKKRGWLAYFAVPKKWIYPLPKSPSPPSTIPIEQRKNFVLIVEDMHLLSMDETLRIYRELVTPDLLDKLFSIIKDLGLHDSVGPNNIPFNEEMKISFIDTDKYHNPNIKFQTLLKHLSPENQTHWEQLIDNQNN